MQWLCYLRSARALGFTLAEIEEGMPLLIDEGGGAPDTAAPLLREGLARQLDQPGSDCALAAHASHGA